MLTLPTSPAIVAGLPHQQLLIVMQGVPGSGKSYTAALLKAGIESYGGRVFVCPTDDFFIGMGGLYRFDPAKLDDYHKLNQERVLSILKWKSSAVVDNCNTRCWEAKPYVQFAVQLGIPVTFIRCGGNFQNTHGVPAETVERMRATQEVLSVEACLKASKPRVKPGFVERDCLSYCI